MKRNRLIVLVLAGTAALHGALASAAVQDNDNLDACCLASEYKLQTTGSNRGSSGTAKAACQVPLGNLSCCIGAEWRLDSGSAPGEVVMVAPPVVAGSQPQSDDRFCCIASEWSSR